MALNKNHDVVFLIFIKEISLIYNSFGIGFDNFSRETIFKDAIDFGFLEMMREKRCFMFDFDTFTVVLTNI